MPIEVFATTDTLEVKLQSVLQTWPLYRVFLYTGADGVIMVPQFLHLYCKSCLQSTFWETHHYNGEDNKQGFTSKSFKCRNCATVQVTYYFYWKQQAQYSQFFKVGQYPELEEHVSDTLTNTFTPEDLKMYKNALRLRNFNLGIAAVAYMRRVVENHMNDMLAILRETAIVHNISPDVLARHEKMMEEKRFSAKIDYAGDLLPASLRPAGHPNPMAVLHDLASDGLHSKTDEECVDIFDECKQTFEYVFGKMRIETEDAKAFVKGIAKLAEKRAKAGEQKPGAV